MSDPRDSQLFPMLETNLRVLQLNIRRSGLRMEALINDHQSQDPDVRLSQKPSVTAYRTHVNRSAWRQYRPTIEADADLARRRNQSVPGNVPIVSAVICCKEIAGMGQGSANDGKVLNHRYELARPTSMIANSKLRQLSAEANYYKSVLQQIHLRNKTNDS